MRHVVVWFGLLGCGNGLPGATSDVGHDCKADLESAIDRTCTVASDCVLVASADCCGTILIGIKSGTEGSFAGVETTYEQCLNCPPLGCQHADQAEDGSTPSADQSIVATCDNGRCKSVVAPASCAPSGSCTDGPTCGTTCCHRGERCDNGTCRCGTGPACGAGDSCEAAGPLGGDVCGSICCGTSGPCPQ